MTLRTLLRLGIALAAGVSIGLLARNALLRLWLQVAPEEDELPPWPQGGNEDPLEESFGDIADGIRLITPEGLEQLRKGADVVGMPPQPNLAQPGSMGTPKPVTPSDEWRDRSTHAGRGGWRRIGGRPLPDCGVLWIFDFNYFELVPACAGVNYAGHYRATLLRAVADAYRYCRQHDGSCPNARMWMLYAFWGCTQQAAGPTVYIRFKFAVACVDA